ncbi:MAG: hypothetical protein ACRDC6_16460 [Shewanella sp.]
MSDSVTYAAAATSVTSSVAATTLTTDQILTIFSLLIAAGSLAIAGFNAYLNYLDKKSRRDKKTGDADE